MFLKMAFRVLYVAFRQVMWYWFWADAADRRLNVDSHEQGSTTVLLGHEYEWDEVQYASTRRAMSFMTGALLRYD
jgi:hypothetical protein